MISMNRPQQRSFETLRITRPSEFEEALAVRYEVFCDEQGIPREIERDDADDVATHVLIRDPGGQAVATGRVLRQRSDGSLVALSGVSTDASDLARIGRMAVRQVTRRSGVGREVMAALEREAVAAGLRTALLHAQLHAAPFYQACGYTPQGPEFLEEDIPHVEMVKQLVP